MELLSTPAPELDTTQWFGIDETPRLGSLRGQVVVIEAFQMLCPGCVTHGLPQAMKVHEVFGSEVTVLGLHTVFEHHAAMKPVSLEAFLHEYRVPFPVGVDRHEPGDTMPVTMRSYGMRGTPTMIVIDRVGTVRHHAFGHQDDMQVGALIGALASEPVSDASPMGPATSDDCNANGCAVSENGATT